MQYWFKLIVLINNKLVHEVTHVNANINCSLQTLAINFHRISYVRIMVAILWLKSSNLRRKIKQLGAAVLNSKLIEFKCTLFHAEGKHRKHKHFTSLTYFSISINVPLVIFILSLIKP